MFPFLFTLFRIVLFISKIFIIVTDIDNRHSKNQTYLYDRSNGRYFKNFDKKTVSVALLVAKNCLRTALYNM